MAPMLMRGWCPDILHETYYSKTSVAPLGCKTVLTVFDMIHELYPDFFAKWDPTRDEKRAAVARADHIICISENTQQDLIRLLGVPAEKTTVVHLGFALTQSQAVILPEPRKPFLLFVGSRGGYKNFNSLLEAYSSRSALKNNYDLVAFGGGGFSAKEQGLIADLGLSMAQVRQMNGDDDILAELYRQATLFVYPSLYEGFGIPPLESMSFGCPVVCSNTSSIPEVVGNAAVLFDPHQSSLIADAIETVTSDKALLTNLRQRGRARVELFSWQECAKQTLEVYRKVLQ
jgi:glycosyltransferase involved in cell wall biosynthesis